ncbi:DUF4440 domain-containing protein [Erythrobacter sp. YT30]|uniref:DUF4440 domain-containing protein n=1 Tax=Erythrobacter sp. YT30 TaxID=1735012 RepID=UPI00076CCA87|nr:DUF4440 domain-containing protein [Erythrobacter sp. YT30]KWV91628.1 hypothetical protein AUC45_10435 [Erythrobacter sp. YT30]
MVLTLALMLAQPEATEGAAPIPPLEEAARQVEARDAELFWNAFEGCDGDKVRALITDDFRMVHDIAGMVVGNGDEFARQISQSCADRAPGGASEGYRNKRLLTAGSQEVTPIGEWGVLQRGWHTFHEWRGEDAGWEQVGGARFINLWKWMPDEGVFRMQETISVDHAAALPYPPVTAE